MMMLAVAAVDVGDAVGDVLGDAASWGCYCNRRRLRMMLSVAAVDVGDVVGDDVDIDDYIWIVAVVSNIVVGEG